MRPRREQSSRPAAERRRREGRQGGRVVGSFRCPTAIAREPTHPPLRTASVSSVDPPASNAACSAGMSPAFAAEWTAPAGARVWLKPTRRVAGRQSQGRGRPARDRDNTVTDATFAQVAGWMRTRAIQPLPEGRTATGTEYEASTCPFIPTTSETLAWAESQRPMDAADASTAAPFPESATSISSGASACTRVGTRLRTSERADGLPRRGRIVTSQGINSTYVFSSGPQGIVDASASACSYAHLPALSSCNNECEPTSSITEVVTAACGACIASTSLRGREAHHDWTHRHICRRSIRVRRPSSQSCGAPTLLRLAIHCKLREGAVEIDVLR